MQRLKTRAQFQATMAGGTLSRTAHFALHRQLPNTLNTPDTTPNAPGPQALSAVAQVWLGAVVPKRWARRAVTRNTIKRQIYTVGALFETQLAQTAHVVRLRCAFDPKQFVSAQSALLRQAVRAELLQLFGQAALRSGGAAGQALAGVSGVAAR